MAEQALAAAVARRGETGKEISRSRQSVAAVLPSAGMREEKHAHQFRNVSRDPLEMIYCICCRI